MGVETQIDLVVIGGGLAGLTAANRAAQFGRKVIVLETGHDESYACNTRIAIGVLNLAHTDPMTDPTILKQAILDDTEGYANSDLADAMSSIAGRAVDWLRSEGIKLIKIPLQGIPRWMFAPPRPLTVGADWKGRGPDVAVQQLIRNLLARGGSIARGTRAERIRTRSDGYIDLDARQGQRGVSFQARAVLLADGGFQGNAELVRRFISRRPDHLLQRSAGTGQGDALLMAEEVGAQLTEASRFYGHLLAQDALKNDRLWPYPSLDTLAGGSIVVDRSGRRFLDEGIGGIAMANAIARLEDPLAATLIFDQAQWDTIGKAELVPPNPHLVSAGGTLASSPDLPGLAASLGIPADNLCATVEAYNRAVETNAGSSLNPPRTPGRRFGELRSSTRRVEVSSIRSSPYHAVRLCAGISYTMGGIAIDNRARVLGKHDTPIPSLLAAGSCTGGIEGGPVAGYIGGLAKALCLGLIAAETMAAPVPER